MTIRTDEDGMRAALAFSAQGRGWTSPRPSVGCVLVRNGEIIGAGHTTPGDGNPHGEIVALNQAKSNGLSARGATAYVTLEPCSHFGTTPPCTNALIEEGIARVVFGVLDPNPAINGRGVRQLQNAGIEVIGEFMRTECVRAQDHFLKNITTDLPFVTLKSAVSLDGKIATKTGDSQWITNEKSRRRAHQMRHEHDAVLVGIETLLHDDAQLNVRLEGRWKQPKRIVVDSRGRIELNAKMLNDGGAPVIVATTNQMPRDKRLELEKRQIRVLDLPHDENNRVDLRHLWRMLKAEKIYSVLVEGGAQISASALKSAIVDKIAFFVAPLIIGGDGISVLPSLGTESLSGALRLLDVQTENLGGDVLVQGYTHEIV